MPGIYKAKKPKLSEREKEFLEKVKEALFRPFDDNDIQKMFLFDENRGKFVTEVRRIVDKFNVVLMPYDRALVMQDVEGFIDKHLGETENKDELVKVISDYMFSFGRVTPLLEDPMIEEIMINGVGKQVFIVDRREGIKRTDIVVEDLDELDWLVDRFLRAGRLDPRSAPIYDGSLEDGSRFNVIVPPASRQPTITVRKFTPEPLSIVDLIRNGTMSVDIAAFLWLTVEGLGLRPANILVVGGTSSGKTTTMNALLGLAPRDSRIITVEDTPELNLLGRDNWIPLYTYYDFKKKVELGLYDLVKASLRMRPDRVIVGEVRGKEAEQLFVAMDIGCLGSMSTVHANSAGEAVTRLTSPPMNVPEEMIPLVDVIVVQQRMNLPDGKTIRRVVEVSEIEKVDRIGFNTLFKWDPRADRFNGTGLPPNYLDKLSSSTGRPKRELMDEMERRKRILEDLARSDITGYSRTYTELEKRLGGGLN